MMWSFYKPKELFLQLAIFAALCLQLAKRATNIKVNLLDMAVIVSFLVLTLGAILPGYPHTSSDSLEIPFYVLLFYLFLQLNEFPDEKIFSDYVKTTFHLMASAGTLVALYGILQHYGLDLLHPHGVVTFGPKAVSTMGHANAFGGFLAALFPFILYRFSQPIGPGEKTIYAIATGVSIWALVLTISRGAWLALAGSLIIFSFPQLQLVWRQHLSTWTRRVAAVGIVALMLLLSLWLVFEINPRSVTGRLFVWWITWDMFTDHPIVGIGYDRYQVDYLNYQASFFDDPSNSIHFDRAANMKQADNEYLQIMAETGLVGLTFFIFLLSSAYIIVYRIFKAAQKTKRDRGAISALATSITVIALHSLVDNPLRNLPTNLVFYFSLGIVSLMAKQLSFFPLLVKAGLSFRNNLVLLSTGLGLLAYNAYDVVRAGKAYVHWQNGQKLVAHAHWYQGIQEYEQAHEVLPNEGELKFHLGAAYAYTKRPEKALVLLRQSQKNFNDKNIYIVQGSAHLQLDRYEEAERSFETVLRMYPKLLLPRLWLAEMYLKLNRNTDALAKLHEILLIRPKVITDEIRSIKRDAENLLKMFEEKEDQ